MGRRVRHTLRRQYRALRLRGATRTYARWLLGIGPRTSRITKAEIAFILEATMRARPPRPDAIAIDRRESPIMHMLRRRA